MAIRYIGRATLNVAYNDRTDQYKVTISARGKHLSTQYVGVPAARRGYGVDHPQAYDEAAHAAASFAANENDDAREALEAGGLGAAGWDVRRTKPRANPRGWARSRPVFPARRNGEIIARTCAYCGVPTSEGPYWQITTCGSAACEAQREQEEFADRVRHALYNTTARRRGDMVVTPVAEDVHTLKLAVRHGVEATKARHALAKLRKATKRTRKSR